MTQFQILPLIALCLGATAFVHGESTGRPNIILVMADDQGWGDAGYTGHPFAQTPHMDAMAKEAHVFDRFYAGAPVCSPTRASVLTARSPIRTKVTNHGRYMRPQEETMAQVLKDAGYVTGIFGKYHLGSAQPNSPCNPGAMGFDEWVIGLNFFDNDPYLSRNGVVEQRKGKGSVLLMDDALGFLEKHRKGDQPMFAVIWFPSPHYPHAEVPEIDDVYEGKPHAGYYREIALLDEQLGRLRAELRKMGIENNTIVWYCSDNGGLVKSSSGGREMKGSIYEGGLRVPALMEWPAQQLSGRSVTPVSTMDMFPTLMAMANVPWKPKHRIDGVDVSELIAGKSAKRSNAIGFWHGFQDGQSTRSDQILKAIMEKQIAGAPLPHDAPRVKKDVDEFPRFAADYAKGHAALNDWPWKLHRINGKRYELYHLIDDPKEEANLSENLEQQKRVEQMKKELHAWMASLVNSINGKDYEK